MNLKQLKKHRMIQYEKAIDLLMAKPCSSTAKYATERWIKFKEVK